MFPHRQLLGRLAMADVVLFVIAALLTNRISTSVVNIIWWLAIAGFALLIVAATVVLVRFVVSRAKRPRQTRQTGRTRQPRAARRQRTR